jgi:hypothetical protein
MRISRRHFAQLCSVAGGLVAAPGLLVSRRAAAASPVVLLENFASLRKNHDSPADDLWAFYGVNQKTSVQSNYFRDVVSGDTGSGYDAYVHFFPYPYIWPWGFMQSYLLSGTFDPACNRMTFWARANQNGPAWPATGHTTDIGTYVKPHADTTPANQGQHYYHQFSVQWYANRWMKFVVTNQPQHQVGGDPTVWPALDPEWAKPTMGGPVHYFDGLTRFYFGEYSSMFTATFDLADFELATVSGEPDAQITSVAGTYTASRYQLFWAGEKNVSRTFEIRYGTSSMHATSFTSGTDGGTVSNRGDSYDACMWQSPAMAQADMYLAVRVQGGTQFHEVFLPAAGPTMGEVYPVPPVNLQSK